MEARRTTLKLALGAGCALAVLAAASSAQAEERTFSLASARATETIPEFARQAGIQIVAPADKLRDVNTPAIEGRYDTREALALLVAGTGLEVASDDGRIVTLVQAPQGASASDGADGTVEALIVTAQKREEDIQDVPIAISAFTQEQLERSQVAGGPDLMTQVPNMTFTKTNFTTYSIQIRGIGTQAISATTDAAVAVAFNNTPFIRNRFFEQEFYDLQRVEVLRGPQGTLYGRNATAGVVNLISRKPTFGYEAKLSADVSNYSSTRLEGMLNIPLAEDVAALRIAGAWTKREGFVTNEITGNPIDGRDLWSTRVSLRLAPTDALDVNLIWEHFEEDDDRLRSGKQMCKTHKPDTIAGLVVPWGQTGPGSNNGSLYDQTFSQGCEAASLYSPDSFQVPNGLRLPYYRALAGVGLPIVSTNAEGKAFDPYASTTQSTDLRVIESTVDPTYQAETNVVELQVNYDLTDALTLTSETAYLNDTIFSSQDYNRFNTRSGAFSTADQRWIDFGVLDEDGVFCDPQIGCADRLVAVDLSTATSKQFSQELRIGSSFDGPFNFSLGANFLRFDTMEKYYVFINTLTMYAAYRGNFGGSGGNSLVPPWEPGVSDNRQCLAHGYREPDPNKVQSVTNCVAIDPNPIGSLNDTGHNYFLSRNPYKLISYAVFGEAYYNITDALKLTAGLRWTVDKKEAPRVPSWVLAAESIGYPIAEVIEQEWREPTGRLTLDWKPDLAFTDETLLYASYAHGYKAGGANPPAAGLVMYHPEIAFELSLLAEQQAAVAPRRFDPEFVDAFEVGAKNTLLDGKLTLNAAAFYYDYQGYQISQIVNRAAINRNFDAKVWGLELEADWRPLENLRLGFKGGYEKTRVADGMRAVDVMDRANGGKPDENGISWFVTAPFPTFPSNCIVPTYLVTRPGGVLQMLGIPGGGGASVCEVAYVMGLDPVTWAEYKPNPQPSDLGSAGGFYYYEGYPGFDPFSAPNGGAGISKDLSGNELPNAPDFTATITADYTLPLPNDWLATLHTDLYYQSEAWTRIFNTEGYDKLKAYTNVNLAAIFTNEAAGWKVMAYVKNVFDRDSITGAFLNSDDTGLTTNVFLTEPRLFGLRVTKEWSGGPWWTGVNPASSGPFPLTVEMSGQVQRQAGGYARIVPEQFDIFPDDLDPTFAQNDSLDWGDGRELRLTYQPTGANWKASAGLRYGRTNSGMSRHRDEIVGPKVCGWPTTGPIGIAGKALCDPTYSLFGGPPGAYYQPGQLKQSVEWADSEASTREQHSIVDFEIGADVGIGGVADSVVGVGIRYADFSSTTEMRGAGVPYDYLVEGWSKYDDFAMHHTRYESSVEMNREFKGVGPTLRWAAAAPLMVGEDTGVLSLDWSVAGGVLFGKQRTNGVGESWSRYYQDIWKSTTHLADDPIITPLRESRNESVSVPLVDLSLGFSYDVGRIKLGAGYRWERYFEVLDVGYDEGQAADRTIDGPYFKLAVGFGG